MRRTTLAALSTTLAIGLLAGALAAPTAQAVLHECNDPPSGATVTSFGWVWALAHNVRHDFDFDGEKELGHNVGVVACSETYPRVATWDARNQFWDGRTECDGLGESCAHNEFHAGPTADGPTCVTIDAYFHEPGNEDLEAGLRDHDLGFNCV